MAYYTKELEGQADFYQRFSLQNYVTIDNNTDGYLTNGGAIFEFKCQINKVDETLFQAIKYLSKLRVKGFPVHKNIILISLNDEVAYCFDSKDFLTEIEKIYIGSASKDNGNFMTSISPVVIEYGKDPMGMQKLLNLIDVQHPQFTKINIDINCVVGWANRYYKQTNNTKIQMFEELRKPTIFKDYINPWTGNEEDFKFIMDCLNDLKNRRELGAFYTPKLFAEKAVELVRLAIDKIPENTTCHDANCEFRIPGEKVHKHYVIIDRCAGTGVLQEPLSDEELKHTILATYELKEWVVLLSNLYEKVKLIIPPTSDNNKGLLNGGDALEQNVFPDIQQYIDDESCSVILFENPPFSEAGGRSFYDQSSKDNSWKNSLVCKNMAKKVAGVATNEKSNVFIWSAFEYYLKKPNDYYIVFSPLKYWKTQNLVCKKFIDGFYCNRGHFGKADKSTLSVFLWSNAKGNAKTLPVLPAYDIINNRIHEVTKIEAKQVFSPLSNLYDKRKDKNDKEGLVCLTNGYEVLQSEYRTKFNLTPLDNDNIIGYMATHGFSPNTQGRILTRIGTANGHGFFLRKNNFLTKLPLFTAACFSEDKWYRKGVYAKTSDGGTAFEKDLNFLKHCLIYTCLSPYNHIISMVGSNKKMYLNELCFDDQTLASNTIKNMNLTTEELSILFDWKVLLEEAKKCQEYNKNFKYGIYQIKKELNLFIPVEDPISKMPQINPKTKKPILKPKYPNLNGKFNPLNKKINEYYKKYIEPELFSYELIK